MFQEIYNQWDLHSYLLLVQSLQKRPSIAPVPAVLEANKIEITVDSDTESEADTDPLDEEEALPWGSPLPE